MALCTSSPSSLRLSRRARRRAPLSLRHCFFLASTLVFLLFLAVPTLAQSCDPRFTSCTTVVSRTTIITSTTSSLNQPSSSGFGSWLSDSWDRFRNWGRDIFGRVRDFFSSDPDPAVGGGLSRSSPELVQPTRPSSTTARLGAQPSSTPRTGGSASTPSPTQPPIPGTPNRADGSVSNPSPSPASDDSATRLNPGRTVSPPATPSATGTQTDGPPKETPPLLDPQVTCGDGVCQAHETCQSCRIDCAIIIDDRLVHCNTGLQRCEQSKEVVIVAISNDNSSTSIVTRDQIPPAVAKYPIVLVDAVNANNSTATPRVLLPFLPPGANPGLLLGHPGIKSLVYFSPVNLLEPAIAWFEGNGWAVVSEEECRLGRPGPLMPASAAWKDLSISVDDEDWQPAMRGIFARQPMSSAATSSRQSAWAIVGLFVFVWIQL
ncbi:hypothetical protein BCR44DRAFT_1288391 [Catenaria anguillulae PL171]|uniref:Uncharacterized protein n=1 Tax=Catenaria anguillulae PL171 TaxID=765915 RepID=A0A1Y2H8G7_9FUNG|nr:hypothetical protein BCR44DRAFT_1288391 [Catenaria anguillulae PL171]